MSNPQTFFAHYDCQTDSDAIKVQAPSPRLAAWERFKEPSYGHIQTDVVFVRDMMGGLRRYTRKEAEINFYEKKNKTK